MCMGIFSIFVSGDRYWYFSFFFHMVIQSNIHVLKYGCCCSCIIVRRYVPPVLLRRQARRRRCVFVFILFFSEKQLKTIWIASGNRAEARSIRIGTGSYVLGISNRMAKIRSCQGRERQTELPKATWSFASTGVPLLAIATFSDSGSLSDERLNELTYVQVG